MNMSFFDIASEMPEEFADELRKVDENLPPSWMPGDIAFQMQWVADGTGEILSVRTFTRREFKNLLAEWG